MLLPLFLNPTPHCRSGLNDVKGVVKALWAGRSASSREKHHAAEKQAGCSPAQPSPARVKALIITQ